LSKPRVTGTAIEGSWNGSVITESGTQIRTTRRSSCGWILEYMAATGVVGRNPMNLWSRIKRRREQLAEWDAQRHMRGILAVPVRTMRQIRNEINREVAEYGPPEWREFQLGVTDRIFALRLWIELNVQLMR
jgi:hypothetical protein